MQLTMREVSFSYDKNRKRLPFSPNAVENIDLTIQQGEFIAIGGPSGSGKSSLIQLIKGLLRPDSGEILIDGINPFLNKQWALFDQIGFVFQYPEHQLFAATVFKDIAFGPAQLFRKKGSADQRKSDPVSQRVLSAMQQMDLDPNQYKDKSPFELSGGEKRRVAIAGVLALQPDVLVLDEPTAGLDFKSRTRLFNTLHDLHINGVTVIVVSHNWEEILAHASRLLVMHHGKLIRDGIPLAIVTDEALMNDIGIAQPDSIRLYRRLLQQGFPQMDRPWDVKEVAETLLRYHTKRMTEGVTHE